jgi:hypothetical protein
MRSIAAKRSWLWIGLAAIVSGGCTGLMRPYDYFNPGDARHQRSIAIAHDPYPLDDVGPEIVGGRPPGFEKSLPEIERARLFNPPRQPLRALFAPAPIAPVPQPIAPSPWPAPPPVQTIPAPYPPPATFPPG